MGTVSYLLDTHTFLWAVRGSSKLSSTDVVKKLDVITLPVNERHAHYAGEFEWEHRDPFDRLLAAQAFSENLTLISKRNAS